MPQRTAHSAKTLPGAYYTSEAVFAREMERIFLQKWLFAGHVSQVAEPGQFFTFQVGHENLIIVRDRQNQVRSFFNVCRHRGARMCIETSGAFASGIQCPYHAWTYGLDGSLTGAPIMNEVAGFRKQDYPLHPVAVRVWEGLVFVNLAADPTPFEQEFETLVGKFSQWRVEELQRVHQTIYDVPANWKLLFQNYSECYHCPGVHPLLNKLTPFRDSFNDLDEGPFLGGPMQMSIPGGSMSLSGQRCAAPLSGISGEDLNLVYYYTIFPNLFLSLHPDYVLIHRAEARAVDRTRIVCDWYFHPDAIAQDGFDPMPAVEFWDMTNREDWHLCTISQQGISSRAYRPGPYADLESQLAAFDRQYLRILGDSISDPVPA